jgi:hypothetical protein
MQNRIFPREKFRSMKLILCSILQYMTYWWHIWSELSLLICCPYWIIKSTFRFLRLEILFFETFILPLATLRIRLCLWPYHTECAQSRLISKAKPGMVSTWTGELYCKGIFSLSLNSTQPIEYLVISLKIVNNLKYFPPKRHYSFLILLW